jgi:hypothetical protein
MMPDTREHTWWVSTPHWTIAVTHQEDTIVAIATILEGYWLGKSWAGFRQWVKRRYPGQ